ncbi:MAG TPA: (Fe-S)-binding protein [Kineosporiaceae bacterium]
MRIAISLLITLVGLALAGRRLWWVVRLIRSGQPANGRFDDVGTRVRVELAEVPGQRKLLKWTVPGLAHFFTMWGFFVLTLTIIELFGSVFDEEFALPVIGRQPWLGFIEDFFAVAVLVALAVFAVIRLQNQPATKHRASRFYGSHTGAAWVILALISLVMILLLVFRGVQTQIEGHFPYGQTWATFASRAIGTLFAGLSTSTLKAIELVLIWLQLAVLMSFLVVVSYSKHLHIGAALFNVAAKRQPKGLGALLPMESGGKPINFEDPGDNDIFGRGKIEDFTWKGMLDFATCTECGRCQSQCPAWNTGKPLSPKLVIMDLRDHLFAKAPFLLAGGEGAAELPADALETVGGDRANGHHGVPESGFGRIPAPGPAQNARPLVGTADQGGVIDPDVLWSCTSCGACVEQCPVDIEHVDHIVDMRRFQVLMESAFPSELGGLFKNLEKSGNPWGVGARTRMEWAKDLPFEVKQVGADVEDLTEVDYLFWVGCAGATEDRAKKTTRAVAELLDLAGVTFAVLGEGESCTGDPARRAGNEFLFQMLAQQNVEVLNEAKATKIVVTCAHCFNTLKNEYPQVGGQYEVVHHTQLLNRLVREGRLTPVAPPSGATSGTVTYHDPCYLGRHNNVYTPPRELIGALPGLTLAEMPRHGTRSFCCGAGGARMWMEENLGTRINNNRADEAVATGADKIGIGCPFCLVMLTDGLTNAQSEGRARQEVEVVDVAQLLLAAVKRADEAAPATA